MCCADADAGLEWRLEILLGISRGLEYLHSNGIIQRDVRPANVLLGMDWQVRGEEGRGRSRGGGGGGGYEWMIEKTMVSIGCSVSWSRALFLSSNGTTHRDVQPACVLMRMNGKVTGRSAGVINVRMQRASAWACPFPTCRLRAHALTVAYTMIFGVTPRSLVMHCDVASIVVWALHTTQCGTWCIPLLMRAIEMRCAIA